MTRFFYADSKTMNQFAQNDFFSFHEEAFLGSTNDFFSFYKEAFLDSTNIYLEGKVTTTDFRGTHSIRVFCCHKQCLPHG